MVSFLAMGVACRQTEDPRATTGIPLEESPSWQNASFVVAQKRPAGQAAFCDQETLIWQIKHQSYRLDVTCTTVNKVHGLGQLFVFDYIQSDYIWIYDQQGHKKEIALDYPLPILDLEAWNQHLVTVGQINHEIYIMALSEDGNIQRRQSLSFDKISNLDGLACIVWQDLLYIWIYGAQELVALDQSLQVVSRHILDVPAAFIHINTQLESDLLALKSDPNPEAFETLCRESQGQVVFVAPGKLFADDQNIYLSLMVDRIDGNCIQDGVFTSKLTAHVFSVQERGSLREVDQYQGVKIVGWAPFQKALAAQKFWPPQDAGYSAAAITTHPNP